MANLPRDDLGDIVLGESLWPHREEAEWALNGHSVIDRMRWEKLTLNETQTELDIETPETAPIWTAWGWDANLNMLTPNNCRYKVMSESAGEIWLPKLNLQHLPAECKIELMDLILQKVFVKDEVDVPWLRYNSIGHNSSCFEIGESYPNYHPVAVLFNKTTSAEASVLEKAAAPEVDDEIDMDSDADDNDGEDETDTPLPTAKQVGGKESTREKATTEGMEKNRGKQTSKERTSVVNKDASKEKSAARAKEKSAPAAGGKAPLSTSNKTVKNKSTKSDKTDTADANTEIERGSSSVTRAKSKNTRGASESDSAIQKKAQTSDKENVNVKAPAKSRAKEKKGASDTSDATASQSESATNVDTAVSTDADTAEDVVLDDDA